MRGFVTGGKPESPPGTSTHTEKTTPATYAGFFIFGMFLLCGAIYQVAYQKWFPLFPVQIDGIFGIFNAMFGLNARIYVSSFIAAVFGLALIWLASRGISKDG